jgi:hypothetical protein
MHGRSFPTLLSGVLLGYLGLALGPGMARAAALSSLIADHDSVRVGDLVFDQFSYAPTGQMPAAVNVIVNPVFDAAGNPGLRFSGGFTDASGGTNTVPQASDALLSYRVTATGSLLSDIHLFGNPQVLGPGDGVMSVTETLRAATQPVQLEIHDTVNGGVASLKLEDAAAFGPLPSIQVVTKDILALNLGGVPTTSFVDQTFSVVAVCEPGSGLVLALGSLGAAGVWWRRRLAVGS